MIGSRLRSIALAVLLIPLPAFAGDAAADMGRMAEAMRTLDYQGSLVYQHGGMVDAMRLFHVGGKEERERIVSLSGPRSEAVRSRGAITCLRGGAPALLLDERATRLLPLVPAPRPGFEHSYTLRSVGKDRVAGYGARVIEIVPRDSFRYGYRIWLEDSSTLPLRAAVVDPVHGRTVEQFMFVALEIGVKPGAADLAPAAAAPAAAPAESIPLPVPRWHVKDAPAGFAFVRALRPAQDAAGAEQQVWSDGLASVSIYVEPRLRSAAVEAGNATVNGVLSLYARDDGAWRVTVVGDVPRATVERIARGVVPPPGLESR